MKPPKDHRVSRPHDYTPAEQTRQEGYLREKWLRLYPGCFEPQAVRAPKPDVRMKVA